MPRYQLTENFWFDEFECPCGRCQGNAHKMTPLVVSNLQQMRSAHGRPIVVTSGIRCRLHNKDVGGVDGSEHLTGDGVDIKASDFPELFDLIRLAFIVGFKRIGIDEKNLMIHLGVSTNHPTPALWGYT